RGTRVAPASAPRTAWSRQPVVAARVVVLRAPGRREPGSECVGRTQGTGSRQPTPVDHHEFIDCGAFGLDGIDGKKLVFGAPSSTLWHRKTALFGAQRFVASHSTPGRVRQEETPDIRQFSAGRSVGPVTAFRTAEHLVTKAKPERSGDAKPTGLTQSA